eukprot:scaffold39729_cov63-Phaeocystis_antarctica.AAC.9
MWGVRVLCTHDGARLCSALCTSTRVQACSLLYLSNVLTLTTSITAHVHTVFPLYTRIFSGAPLSHASHPKLVTQPVHEHEAGSDLTHSVGSGGRMTASSPNPRAAGASLCPECADLVAPRLVLVPTLAAASRGRRQRHALLGALAHLLYSLGIPASAGPQLAVVLEAATAHQLVASAGLEADVPVLLDVLLRGLVRHMHQLHAVAHAQQLVDERLDTGGVVVPPSSVHVGTVLERDDRRSLVLSRVERVVDVGDGVGASHGLSRVSECVRVWKSKLVVHEHRRRRRRALEKANSERVL